VAIGLARDLGCVLLAAAAASAGNDVRRLPKRDIAIS
jgi:hypothetical protein